MGISDFKPQPKYCISCGVRLKFGQYTTYDGYAVCLNPICKVWILSR